LKGFKQGVIMLEKVEFTCASVKEKSQTIRTNQLSNLGFNFKDGESYKITFVNGKTAVATVSRNGATLYISAKSFPRGLDRATVARLGGPVTRNLKSIKKVK